MSSPSGWERFLRPQVSEDCSSPLAASFAEQDVLITGAGGSIGSALSFCLSRSRVGRLILLDSSEQNLFELQRRICDPKLEFVLGSAGDFGLLQRVLKPSSSAVILHAAAYKHLGLLQRNAFAAIENNVFVTEQVIKAAQGHGRCDVLLISTDKAAGPTSVMGASKRIAEILTLSAHGAAVETGVIRLCNIIGTSGSVVPIFSEQIRSGNPITLTHKEARRYFLTIGEAVHAILQAALSLRGELMVAPVSEPVLIADLAAELQRNAGVVRELKVVGLQPGEKLVENLAGPNEFWVQQDGAGLLRLMTNLSAAPELAAGLSRLRAAVEQSGFDALRSAIHSLVPEYAA